MKKLFLAIVVISTFVVKQSYAQSEQVFRDFRHVIAENARKINAAGVDSTVFVKYKASMDEDKTNRRIKINLVKPGKKEASASKLYESNKRKNVLIGLLYKCPYCSDWHLRAQASAFAISTDGYLVTNWHVANFGILPVDTAYAGMIDRSSTLPQYPVVMDYDGNVYPIEEISSYNKEGDVAIIKIDTKGKEFDAYALGATPAIGEKVYSIHTPMGSEFFYLSEGIVSQYKGDINNEFNNRVFLSTEYSVGSSGGGIYDAKGNIIGIISATRSVVSGTDGMNHQQLILRESIPVSTLKKLIQ